MKCPFCNASDTKVLDSRDNEDQSAIKRRRYCANCEKRFSTLETTSLQVIKRNGKIEPFSKEKLADGLKKATVGRAIDNSLIDKLAFDIENSLRAKSSSQVDSFDIGLAVLKPLAALDQVAYLRYASVYMNFSNLEDFTKEIANLQNHE